MCADTNDTFQLIGNIRPESERLSLERSRRMEDALHIIPLGVSFLNDALGGAAPGDIFLLSGKTGIGKTQLAMLLAMEISRTNRRVLYMALENEEYEIERRVKFQRISGKFYALDRSHPIRRAIKHLNYQDWYYGNLDHALDEIEKEIDAEGSTCPNLHVFYRSGGFDICDFERLFMAKKDHFDAFFVDHLHYFDLPEGENENRAFKDIMKKIRDCALIARKPVFLVAHIRKSNRMSKEAIPSIDDIHGTSDIAKIATKSVMIAPAPSAPGDDFLRNTFFEISKHRVDGTRTSTIGLIPYNVKIQRYEREYSTGKLSLDRTEFMPDAPGSSPYWAANAIRGEVRCHEY